jgi:hypothetical protein
VARGAAIQRVVDLQRRHLDAENLGQVLGVIDPGLLQLADILGRDLRQFGITLRAVSAAEGRPVLGRGRDRVIEIGVAGLRRRHRQRGRIPGCELHAEAQPYDREHRERRTEAATAALAARQACRYQQHRNDEEDEGADQARHQRPAVQAGLIKRPDQRGEEGQHIKLVAQHPAEHHEQTGHEQHDADDDVIRAAAE